MFRNQLVILAIVLVGLTASMSVEVHFADFMERFDKVYDTEMELLTRFAVFRENLKHIESINNDPDMTWDAEIKHHTDLTFQEFGELFGLMTPQDCSATASSMEDHPFPDMEIPSSMDWRDKNVVSPIKNQGSCGSCWTFSTTGCLESAHAIATGEMIILSEQNLVDCAGAFNNFGCDGGLPSQAFEYIRYNGGIDTEATYPYTAVDGDCVYDPDHVGATVSDVFNITQSDENQLLQAVGSVGPVSIAYEVTNNFRFYKSGVYVDPDCHTDPQHVNHAVLAVGYGTTSDDVDYWIVKNSWGTSFGMDGYFWISRGTDECGLAECASYPIV